MGKIYGLVFSFISIFSLFQSNAMAVYCNSTNKKAGPGSFCLNLKLNDCPAGCYCKGGKNIAASTSPNVDFAQIAGWFLVPPAMAVATLAWSFDDANGLIESACNKGIGFKDKFSEKGGVYNCPPGYTSKKNAETKADCNEKMTFRDYLGSYLPESGGKMSWCPEGCWCLGFFENSAKGLDVVKLCKNKNATPEQLITLHEAGIFVCGIEPGTEGRDYSNEGSWDHVGCHGKVGAVCNSANKPAAPGLYCKAGLTHLCPSGCFCLGGGNTNTGRIIENLCEDKDAKVESLNGDPGIRVCNGNFVSYQYGARENNECNSGLRRTFVYSCGDGTGIPPDPVHRAYNNYLLPDNSCVPPNGYTFDKWSCSNGRLYISGVGAGESDGYFSKIFDFLCTAQYSPLISNCGAGKYLENNQCVDCPVGYYCPGDNAKHQCTGIRRVATTTGQSQCSNCRPNEQANDTHTACVPWSTSIMNNTSAVQPNNNLMVEIYTSGNTNSETNDDNGGSTGGNTGGTNSGGGNNTGGTTGNSDNGGNTNSGTNDDNGGSTGGNTGGTNGGGGNNTGGTTGNNNCGAGKYYLLEDSSCVSCENNYFCPGNGQHYKCPFNGRSTNLGGRSCSFTVSKAQLSTCWRYATNPPEYRDCMYGNLPSLESLAH